MFCRFHVGLLCDAGVTVVENVLTFQDFDTADEIFSTGNYSKVVLVTKIEEHLLQPGRFYTKACELYWLFAHSSTAVRL